MTQETKDVIRTIMDKIHGKVNEYGYHNVSDGDYYGMVSTAGILRGLTITQIIITELMIEEVESCKS